MMTNTQASAILRIGSVCEIGLYHLSTCFHCFTTYIHNQEQCITFPADYIYMITLNKILCNLLLPLSIIFEVYRADLADFNPHINPHLCFPAQVHFLSQ